MNRSLCKETHQFGYAYSDSTVQGLKERIVYPLTDFTTKEVFGAELTFVTGYCTDQDYDYAGTHHWNIEYLIRNYDYDLKIPKVKK